MARSEGRSGIATLLLDPLEPTAARAERAHRFEPDTRVWLIPLILGGALLALSIVGWITNPKAFYLAYLLGWSFCLSLTLGALFFVMVQHITRAHWSVVFRRVPESLLWSFPLLAVLSIPIFLGMHDLYHWTHYGPEADHLLQWKQPYLNIPFFAIRMALYFIVWTVLAYKLYTISVDQDVHPEADSAARLRKVSAIGIPLFAVTTAFASYDLLMSLDYHWYSTIFGVYFFSGAFWSFIAFTIVVILTLQRNQKTFDRVVRTDHLQDLGKFLFAFTVFWAYIAFSQYMLIWYGNIPEETVWYRHRMEHGWEYHSLALLVAHFILPFIILLPRASKRMMPLLAVMSVWALVMQWFDLHWLIAPTGNPDHAGIHWLDVTCWLGLFGIFVGLFLYRLARHSIVPQNDPRLIASTRFQNV